MPGGSPAITAAVFRAVRTGNAFEETVERLLEGVKLGVYARVTGCPGTGADPQARDQPDHAAGGAARAGRGRVRRDQAGPVRRNVHHCAARAHGADELSRTARDMGGQLDDALTFRRVVETGAAEMAARASLTMQQRESLAECLAAVHACEPSGYRQADTRLHLAIADAAGSPLLTASVVEARVRLVDLLNAIPMLGRNLEHANVQHTRIVQAIFNGSPTGPGARWKNTSPGPPRCSAASLASPEPARRLSGNGCIAPW